MKGTILEEFLLRVHNGEKFHIDFEKRNMKVGKDYLIKNGVIQDNRNLKELEFLDFANPILLIEDLYEEYKYSVPSERSEDKRRKYFKALPMDELTMEQIIYGNTREYAQAKLEGTILCMILMKILVWNQLAPNQWFWQSKTDPDLVLINSWIEGRCNCENEMN